MRVLFSNPPWYQWEGPGKPSLRGVRAGSRWPHQFSFQSNGPVDGKFKELIGGYIPFPVFLGTAAALARRHGFEIEMRDSVASGETYENYYADIEKFQPRAVVIETSTPTIKIDIGIVNEIRKRVPGVTVIFTGMHFELAETTFLDKYPQVDFTVIGEYEYATVAILEQIRQGTYDYAKIEGIVYRSIEGAAQKGVEETPLVAEPEELAAGGGCATGEKNTTTDLQGNKVTVLQLASKANLEAKSPAALKNDFKKLGSLEALPWAERDGLPMENYYDGVCGLQRPQLQLMATRGCPYGCIFCGWPQLIFRGPKYRVRTAKDVANEIKTNLEKVPYKSFYIDDDTVNIRKKYILELAAAIKEAGLHTIPWGTMGRADLMDDEMLDALKDAGLFSIKYGVETADQDLLNEIGKNISIDEVIDGIERTKAKGIKVHLTFTFGLPSDTPETIERTIQLACRLPVDTVQFSISTPYPGTEMYRLYKEKGWLVNENWEEYLGSHRAVARTDHFSPEQLEEWVKEAYSRFWEEKALRQLQTPQFEQRLRNSLPVLNADGTPTPVVVTQSARPGLTRVVVRTLQKLGYEAHVLTHERFVPSFEYVVEDEQIHSFNESYNFSASQLRERLAALSSTVAFAAAVVPYHNATGANYDEVHAVAGDITNGPVVGVTVTADVRTERGAVIDAPRVLAFVPSAQSAVA